MKRILNHFFQTMMMLMAVGVIFILPDDVYASYINWGILGLIVLVLIGTGCYLYRARMKGLLSIVFACALLCPVLCFAANVDNSEAESYYKGLADGITTDFCQLKNDFDADEAIEDPDKAPKEEDIVAARKYLDILREAKQAGVILAKTSIVSGSGTVYGGYQTTENEYSRKKTCANEYLDEVAEYIVKKYETQMTTVYKVLEADKEYCWPCAIVHLAMRAVENICIAVEDKIKAAAIGLLGILFLFWILIKVLMLIGQFGTGDNGAFFTAFLTRAFLAIIAVAILEKPMGWLYGQTLSPLIGVTAEIAQRFVNKGAAAQGFESSTADSSGMGSQLAGSTNLMCACCASGNTTDCNGDTIELIEYPDKVKDSEYTADTGTMTDKGLLSVETKRELLCLTCATYKQTAPMIAAGRVLMYWSLHEKTDMTKLVRKVAEIFTGGIAHMVPYPLSWWLLGILLAFAFTWLAFSIAFRFIDIFLRIGFAFLLTPLLVTCFVFPITRQYTQRGWEFLVHALLSMLALAMGISLTMTVFMTSLPNNVVNSLNALMTQDTDPTNTYADQLYEAFASGGFYTVLLIVAILFIGLSVIKASQVIIEGLSGITSSIPSLSGAAVMGAVHASLAPYRMAKAATLDALTRANGGIKSRKDKEPNSFEEAPSKASKLGQFTENSVNSAGKAMENGGKAVEKGGAAAGKGLDAAGKGTAAAGQSMMQGGAELSATGLGAVVGVPLAAAGAAATAAGYGAQAAGKGVEAGSKAAGEGMKAAGKATQKAAKPMGKAAEKTAERAGKLKDGAQAAGGAAADTAKGDQGKGDADKGKKGGSTLGKMGMEAWDLADQALDKGLAEADKSFEDEHMPEPEPEQPKSGDDE